jgi:predicted ATP-dependent endonuclease of OLD family
MDSDARQYILATHAPEFAPVSTNKGKVFRCTGTYTNDTTEIHLSINLAADRRDAFTVLEALGVHPSRTLFTANVVIWVEGPTELLLKRPAA